MANDTPPVGPAPDKLAVPEVIPAPVQTIDIGGAAGIIIGANPVEQHTDTTPPEATPAPVVSQGQPLVAQHTDTTPPVATPGGQPVTLSTAETSPATQSADTMTTEAAPADKSAVITTTAVNVGQQPSAPPASSAPHILVIDIGGTKVKMLVSGQTEPRKAPTGKEFTPARLIEAVREQARDWEYEAITIGYPGLVGPQGPRSEPGNLGPGWVGFDFTAAFGKPVKMINDAAMQALGSYEGGRMLFLGLGTGLGSTLITGQVIVPLELGRLLYSGNRTLGQILGRSGLAKIGKAPWQKAVNKAVIALMNAFIADYIVIGGGNAKLVKELPPGTRRGHNLTAFRGGFRLWSVEDVWVLATSGGEHPAAQAQDGLRML